MSPIVSEPMTVTPAELQASTPELLAQVKETGQALSVRGGWVVLDAAEYERLLERDSRLAALHAVQTGIREIDEGKCRPLTDVNTRLRKKRFGHTA